MYQNILVAVEHSKADEAILDHIVRLAQMTKARLLLVHVADGFAARHFNDLQLRESDEMRDDRAYLARRTGELQKAGLEVSSRLAPWRPLCIALVTEKNASSPVISFQSAMRPRSRSSGPRSTA